MQAIPHDWPFVPNMPGLYEYRIEISLPPLIPGIYSLSFWIGPHYTQTYDLVQNALAFEVFESPTGGRTFPHSPHHGHIVPPSRCELMETQRVLESIS